MCYHYIKEAMIFACGIYSLCAYINPDLIPSLLIAISTGQFFGVDESYLLIVAGLLMCQEEQQPVVKPQASCSAPFIMEDQEEDQEEDQDEVEDDVDDDVDDEAEDEVEGES